MGLDKKQYSKDWFAKNKHRLKKYRKAADLQKNYGLRLEDFNTMLVNQSALCAICKQPETQVHPKSGLPYSLSVDHCHKTVGAVDDDYTLLEKMIVYIKRHSQEINNETV